MEVRDLLAQLEDIAATLKAGEHTFNDCSAVLGGGPPSGTHAKTLRLLGPSGVDARPSPPSAHAANSRVSSRRPHRHAGVREGPLHVLRHLADGRFRALPNGRRSCVLHHICTTREGETG